MEFLRSFGFVFPAWVLVPRKGDFCHHRVAGCKTAPSFTPRMADLGLLRTPKSEVFVSSLCLSLCLWVPGLVFLADEEVQDERCDSKSTRAERQREGEREMSNILARERERESLPAIGATASSGIVAFLHGRLLLKY